MNLSVCVGKEGRLRVSTSAWHTRHAYAYACAGGRMGNTRVHPSMGSDGEEYRVVRLRAAQPLIENSGFCTNKVCTSLYVRGLLTPFIFLIKGVIYEEFRKLPNAYFFFIGCLQTWHETTNTEGTPTTAPALSIMISLSCVLKLLQDLERYRADKALNRSHCMRLVGTDFAVSRWVDVKVGDFIKVHDHEALPADIVLVAAFEPNPNAPVGACHVETKSLDGETNLKGRSVPRLFCSLCGGTIDEQMSVITSLKMRGQARRPARSCPRAVRSRFGVHPDQLAAARAHRTPHSAASLALSLAGAGHVRAA